MDDFRRGLKKEPDYRNFGCGCCGYRLHGDKRRPHRRRARARLKQKIQKEMSNGN